MTSQPSLNPDALDHLATVVLGCTIEEWNDHDDDEKRQVLAPYRRTIETYLAVAQPVVNSVEELEALPVDSVVLDRFDYPHHKCAQSTPDFKNLRTGHHISRLEFYLPARVVFRPEVKS